MLDEEEEDEMIHEAISRSVLREEQEEGATINNDPLSSAATESIEGKSSSSTHNLSANIVVVVDDDDNGVFVNDANAEERSDKNEHSIANGSVNDGGQNSSLDATTTTTLNSTISKPQHEDGTTISASRLKTDEADLTISHGLQNCRDLDIDTIMKQPAPPLSTETTSSSSLLSRGISLFSRGSKQQQQQQQQSHSTRNESDCNSVVSEMTPDVKSAATAAKKSNKIVEDDDDENNNDDNILRQNLEEAGLVLLKRLIEFLSECPPAFDEGTTTTSLSSSSGKKKNNTKKQQRQRGLTLPASAIGWLSTQIYDTTTTYSGDCSRVSKQQLRCITKLFKRVTSLRISGEEWPPPMAIPSSKKTVAVAGSLVNTAKKSITTNLLSKFSTDTTVDDDVDVDDDDASCGTTTTTTTDNTSQQNGMSLFQRYYYELKTNPRVNMSFFTNATKVIIDGIPPNWVTELDSLTNLEMFQYEKGCIVDINQLFFPLNDEGLEKINHIPESTKPFEYMSLTKLRLSNCAMGETAGLRGRRKRNRSGEETTLPRIPPFSRFPNLVSLNISHNELHKMKTILAGLSSLPLLSSLDLSYNRLSRYVFIYIYICLSIFVRDDTSIACLQNNTTTLNTHTHHFFFYT
jgi:hypothetical protein